MTFRNLEHVRIKRIKDPKDPNAFGMIDGIRKRNGRTEYYVCNGNMPYLGTIHEWMTADQIEHIKKRKPDKKISRFKMTLRPLLKSCKVRNLQPGQAFLHPLPADGVEEKVYVMVEPRPDWALNRAVCLETGALTTFANDADVLPYQRDTHWD